jgi:predicted homoserine dehydrogenase-like protein
VNTDKIRIAIIGAGQTGTPLLGQLIGMNFIDVVKIADTNEDAPGIIVARERNIPVTKDYMDIARMGRDVDMIIDVTGVKEVRNKLREYMAETDNKHTVIVPELVAILLLSLAKGELVRGHGYQQYA